MELIRKIWIAIKTIIVTPVFVPLIFSSIVSERFGLIRTKLKTHQLGRSIGRWAEK